MRSRSTSTGSARWSSTSTTPRRAARSPTTCSRGRPSGRVGEAKAGEAVEPWFRERRASVGVVIPEHYERSLQRGEPASVQILVDAADNVTAGAVLSYTSRFVAPTEPRLLGRGGGPRVPGHRGPRARALQPGPALRGLPRPRPGGAHPVDHGRDARRRSPSPGSGSADRWSSSSPRRWGAWRSPSASSAPTSRGARRSSCSSSWRRPGSSTCPSADLLEARSSCSRRSSSTRRWRRACSSASITQEPAGRHAGGGGLVDAPLDAPLRLRAAHRQHAARAPDRHQHRPRPALRPRHPGHHAPRRRAGALLGDALRSWPSARPSSRSRRRASPGRSHDRLRSSP